MGTFAGTVTLMDIIVIISDVRVETMLQLLLLPPVCRWWQRSAAPPLGRGMCFVSLVMFLLQAQFITMIGLFCVVLAVALH